ncbi:radical SAM protein [Campylobacter lari]|uniref:radical SAM/SPASM domain-containing protein n=1 Tax=Campylobacter lari TaxID=201 RepID=UPI0021F6E243|nr:radical SAM/SPASM domain-containing protein [Campylobacter lari]EIY6495414.1 radical SAM protein [Campylobacter lari]MCW0205430.1 radical SAM protein [Campylobacter lari]HEG5920452.1 radical SAM protein [Campylobacter lari]
METLKRNETSFTGVFGLEKMNELGKLKDIKKWNEYRTNYDKLSKLEFIPKMPIQIDFELNATCNLSCPMCPLSVELNSQKKQFEFSFELFAKIIDEGVNKGELNSVRLNYLNEPLLRGDLEKFIRYAKDRGILDIYFSTNGILLNKDRAKSLIESGLDRIQISLDANSEELYNQMRPGGNYKKVVNNVLNLIELKKQMKSLTPLVRVNFVRTEINEHELENFIGFWENKVDMIGVQEMVKPPRSKKEIKSRTTEKKSEFRCSFPYKNLVFTAEGNVLPCCTFYGDEMPIGNVYVFLQSKEAKNKGILEYFWNHSKIDALRILHKNAAYAKNTLCKKCVEGSLLKDE